MAPQDGRSPKSDLKPYHHLSAGALSGLTSALALQPLDLLKTRLQQGHEGEAARRKLIPVVNQILREDGVTGLWRGTIPTVVRSINVPGVALYFYSLSAIRTRLSNLSYFSISSRSGDPSSRSRTSSTMPRLSSQGNLMAGAIARTTVGFVLNPITILKARYESSRFSEYRSLYASFRSLLADGGIKGLFRGWIPTAARDAPYAGMSLLIYEKCKDVGSRMGLGNAATHSGSGAAAATLATLLTSPADVVKTRMQVSHTHHPTISTVIAKIYSDSGIPGFFSGSTLRISRKAASSAIAWTVYEGLLLFLRDRGL